jgi:osmotically inducible protein OsmC
MRTSNAAAVWEGTLRAGHGSFSGESGGIGGQYTFSSRFEGGTGSNPEELLAAAEAACYSMALSGNLEKAGATPRKIESKAACTVEKTDAGMTVTTIKLDVTVAADGISSDEFQKVALATRDTCPVSRAFKGNVKMELSARLA